MVFVISVVSVIPADAALNPLVCCCLSCLRHFRRFCDSHCFVKGARLQTIGFGNHRFRNARDDVIGADGVGAKFPFSAVFDTVFPIAE